MRKIKQMGLLKILLQFINKSTRREKLDALFNLKLQEDVMQ